MTEGTGGYGGTIAGEGGNAETGDEEGGDGGEIADGSWPRWR